jgi:phospholipase A1
MWSGFRIDTGAEHESNGKDIPASRSWNRLYIMPYFENDYIIATLKAWYRLQENKKDGEEDVAGDDNPGIHRFWYGELASRKISGLVILHLLRLAVNPAIKKGC